MLTPVFEASQNDQFLLLKIRAPYAKVTDAEIEYDGNEFFFVSKPYYLRLYLPNSVVDNGTGTASYDSDTGYFNVCVPKLNVGEWFANLDMMTELLRPKGNISARPLIEECPSDSDNDAQSSDMLSGPLIEQKLAVEQEDSSFHVSHTCGYGFAALRHGVFATLQEEIQLLIDLTDPDLIPAIDRSDLCYEYDVKHFNEEHYLYDLLAPEVGLTEALEFDLASDEKLREFSLADRDRMKDLPKRSFDFLSTAQNNLVAITLVDLLFAYCYDVRTTQTEHTVESGWTIQKLSSTLSFLVTSFSVRQTLLTSIRRSLCFPLYRHWTLALKVRDDVCKVVRAGRSAMLRCLLEMHRILACSGDYRYILNDLYLTDYCVWIQSVHESVLTKLTTDLAEICPNKSDIGLDLDTVELMAEMAKLGCEHERGRQTDASVRTDAQCLRSIASAIQDSDDESSQ